MKQLYAICFFLGSITASFSQVLQDDFSDGNFNNNPTWTGTSTDFVVNANNQLQTNNLGTATTSEMSTAAAISDSTVWKFYVEMTFNPSTSNYTKIYLQSDNSSPAATTNGYYLQIGASGSNDALELYRVDGGSSTQIWSGTVAAVASSPTASIKIVRSNAGLWKIYADYTGGTAYSLEGTVTDATHRSGTHFGLLARYSATRGDKFYFDNIHISPLTVDTSPPLINLVRAISLTTVDVYFNEPLKVITANIAANYTINNGIVVSSALLDANNPTLVHLVVSPLTSAINYELTTRSLSDLQDNLMNIEQFNFIYYHIQTASFQDIIINEIMADPTPSIGLPAAEFVELYNRSNKYIQLGGMVWNDGSNKTLPRFILAPDSMVLLASSSNVAAYATYGNCLDIGTLSLSNNGELLSLTSATGIPIDVVDYDKDWYKEATKDDGGWSLELCNPNLLCINAANWRASTAIKGGTPGQKNSIWDDSPDTQAPHLLRIEQYSNHQILLEFDEVMNEDLLVNLNNYTINNNTIASVLSLGDNIYIINLVNNMIGAATYTVGFVNITDCIGNAVASNSANLMYYETFKAAHYDIIINEIMADPNPPVGLPAKEYIELYNRSGNTINLQNFTITDGSTIVARLPYFLLQPDSYVLLHKGGDTISFAAYGASIALAVFPDLNTADDLVFYNNQGVVVDAVSYELSWYQNGDKETGGWSLERINPNRPCEGATNWAASQNLLGGSPCTINSIWDDVSDQQSPDAWRAFPIDSTHLRVYFSEAIDDQAAANIANYSLDQGGINIIQAYLEPPFYNTVILTLQTPLSQGIIYNLTMLSGFTDCVGNPIALNNKVRIALPETINKGDLILNEILFNPVTGGKDFIELYNHSNKVLNVADLVVSNAEIEDGNLQNIRSSQTNALLVNHLVFPREYVVISEDINQIQGQYYSPNHSVFVEDNLPSFSDKEGHLFLYVVHDSTYTDALGNLQTIQVVEVLDNFDYTDDLHSPFIDDLNGVSLERIDFEAPTNDPANWHSASTTVGYATPSYQNSSFMINDIIGEDLIELSSETISPDGDGYEDFLMINYNIDALGYVANIDIYDANGRLVRNLINGELLMSEGSFQWDGSDNQGQKTRVGIYVLAITVFNPKGDVQRFRKTCVVAGKM